MDKQKKTASILIRCTPEEKSLIERKATESHLDVSDYMLTTACNAKIHVKVGRDIAEDILFTVQRLKDFRDNGLLTQREFELAKLKIFEV